MKYGMSDLIKAFREPYLGMREMNKVYHTRFGRYNYFPKGVDVFEQKWDNLIILDACRYDIFKEEYNLPGELEYRISRASMSKEFINGNFSNKKHHDTVYLSGNSWYARKCREINAELHEFELIKAEGKEYYIEKPKMITEEAIKADDEYPNKRLIVHYMLPHFPYIGPTARQTFPDIETQRETLFRDLRRGNADISDEQLKQAYRENLDIVLHMIEKLFDEFTGRTVVTADHGELLGERVFPIPHKEYGHPPKMWVTNLLKVPWLIYENGEKGEIISEAPSEDNLKGITNEKVVNHLQELGYL